MYRDIVFLQDAVIAISMVEASMATSAVLGQKSVVRSLFPCDPEAYCILFVVIWKQTTHVSFLHPENRRRRRRDNFESNWVTRFNFREIGIGWAWAKRRTCASDGMHPFNSLARTEWFALGWARWDSEPKVWNVERADDEPDCKKQRSTTYKR